MKNSATLHFRKDLRLTQQEVSTVPEEVVTPSPHVPYQYLDDSGYPPLPPPDGLQMRGETYEQFFKRRDDELAKAKEKEPVPKSDLDLVWPIAGQRRFDMLYNEWDICPPPRRHRPGHDEGGGSESEPEEFAGWKPLTWSSRDGCGRASILRTNECGSTPAARSTAQPKASSPILLATSPSPRPSFRARPPSPIRYRTLSVPHASRGRSPPLCDIADALHPLHAHILRRPCSQIQAGSSAAHALRVPTAVMRTFGPERLSPVGLRIAGDLKVPDDGPLFLA
ncbi:hypothetical protein BXZ70DRAFT_1009309 [Cristinia sonorae]|uniref:Uncharacterized protein n=1 Tax=Cristinia sonorae TaxID=1940300 RepID=A0A8K0ULU3_9AGAR|nr:hypothetical protein BXZ70DRAFT_1009309 [Cristinia sonorae]